MGHYSLWQSSNFSIWRLRYPSNHAPAILHAQRERSRRIKNDYSFPSACTIRFKFAAKETGRLGPFLV